jgi:hypothetical protein
MGHARLGRAFFSRLRSGREADLNFRQGRAGRTVPARVRRLVAVPKFSFRLGVRQKLNLDAIFSIYYRYFFLLVKNKLVNEERKTC